MQLGSRLGFDLEPLSLLRVDRRRERQDFQGDAPAQRELLRLVDDAHPAPPHFPKDSIVTESCAGEYRLGRRARPILIRLDELDRRRLDEFQAGEALAKRIGDLCVPGQELVPRTRLARSKGLQVRLQCGDHPRIVSLYTLEGRRRGGSAARHLAGAPRIHEMRGDRGGHSRLARVPDFRALMADHRYSSRVRRNRANARSHTFLTLSSVRPIRRATSGKLRPSR